MIIPKDTVINLNGFPFKLTEDTKVDGNLENLKLALDIKNDKSTVCSKDK